MYDFADPNFKRFPWEPLSALEIASIAYVFFVAFIGFAAFSHPKTGLLVAFIIFLILSILFTMAISIFAIVAGSTGFINALFGCNAPINGIMSIWRGMDNYLVNVDQNLCSPACPCFISNTGAFTTNQFAAPFFNQFTRSTNPADPINFQGCSNTVHVNVYNAARLANGDFDPNNDFNQENFWAYMARVENRFQCSGFCQNNYFNTVTNSQFFITKFLFTDINRGPPLFTGCWDQYINFLPPFLNAFGAVGLLLAGFEIFALAFAIALLRHRKKHHHDKEVVVDSRPVVSNQPVVAYERKDVYIERP